MVSGWRNAWLRAISSRLFLIFVIGISDSVHADNLSYGYDSLGRVVEAVNNTSGQATEYSYDAVGNLTGTKVVSTTTLSIAGSSDNQSPGGSQITIYGTGFSTTAANNTVTINGVAATVISSTSTQLVVSVPIGAGTGAISVTTSNGSTTSSATTAQQFALIPFEKLSIVVPLPMTGTGNGNFTVANPTNSPTITGFTPASGSAGTAVTVTGTNFQVVDQDKVLINNTAAQISTASSNAIGITVPPDVSSGLIEVVTPYGSATSSSTFIVPTPGYTAATIGSTGTTTINGSQLTLPVSSASQIELAFFDAPQDDTYDRVVVQGVSGSFEVIDPHGNVIATSSSIPAAIDLPTLPYTGTYTVAIAPSSASNSAYVLVTKAQLGTLDLTWESQSTYPGRPLVSGSGQEVIESFTGVTNQTVGINLISNSNSSITLRLLASSGAIVWTSSTQPNNAGITASFQTSQLPSNDTYRLVFDPGISSFSLHYQAGLLLNGSLSSGGSFTFAPGIAETGRATFQGTAGQSIAIDTVTISGQAPYQRVFYYNAQGQETFIETDTQFTSNFGILVRSLPATTTYYVEFTVSPSAQPFKGTVQSFAEPMANLSETSAGSNFTFASSDGVTIGLYTFSGTAGDTPALGFTGGLYGIGIYVINLANQSTAFSYKSAGGTQTLYLGTLPVTGQYQLILEPNVVSPGSGPNTFGDTGIGGSFTGQIGFSAPITTTLSPGTPQNLNTKVPGQYMVLSISVSSNSPGNLSITNVSGCNADVAVYSPGQNSTPVNTGNGGSEISPGGTYKFSLMQNKNGVYQALVTPYPGCSSLSLTATAS